MKATLKQIHSPDIDLDKYWPIDESNFGFLLELSVGLENSKGADIFQLMVCTPDWLKNRNELSKTTWLRHMLLVSEYDIQKITAEINRQIDAIEADSWTDIAVKLGRFCHWEFEDYRP